MTRVARRCWCRGGGVAAIIAVSLMGGCESSPSASPDMSAPAAVPTKPVPAFAEVAARYNERADRIKRLWARAVVRLTYSDEKGESHTDQGEGVLQMARPDRVALSIKKAGKMLFWLGCDLERYWFFDVVDEKTVRLGRNPSEGESLAADAAGIGIPPRELFELIGMIPVDPAGKGSVAWSGDGAELVVTLPKQGRGSVAAGSTVLWLSSSSFEPSRVERRDASGRVIIRATLTEYEGVEIEGEGGLKPRLATKLDAFHEPSGAQIRLDLSEMRDSGIGDAAFVFETLRRSLGVERVIDVDAEAKRPGTANQVPRTDAPVVTTPAIQGSPKTPEPRTGAPVRGTPIAPRKPVVKP